MNLLAHTHAIRMILNHSPDVLRNYLAICDQQIKWAGEQGDQEHIAFYEQAKAEAIEALREKA